LLLTVIPSAEFGTMTDYGAIHSAL